MTTSISDVQRMELAEKLLNLLSSQEFYDWYNTGPYCNYISGDDEAPTKQHILNYISDALLRRGV
jgi:hypothetical protein